MDLWITFDGRSPSNFTAMGHEMTKVLKKAWSAESCGLSRRLCHICKVTDLELPVRLWTSIRRMYQCHEFFPGEYAAPSRSHSLNPKMPEPLENMTLTFTKSFTLPSRVTGSSRYTLASNRTRAWPNLRMKTLEEQELTSVSRGTYDDVLGHAAGGDDKTGDALAGVMHSDDSDTGPVSESRDDAIFLCPWEGPESDTEALLDMFRPESVTGKLIFLTPGSGMSVLSAVRQKLPSVVFCDSQCHKEVIFEAVLLRIMYAMIAGSDTTGFELNKRVRVLSRQASLTGKSDAATSVTSPQAESQEAQPKREKHSSSESSSTSEDDDNETQK